MKFLLNMKSFVILLFIIIQLEAKIVNLPDGRIFDILEQEKYAYILIEDSPASLERLYIVSAEQTEANFLCPKGYSIQEIIQELVVNQNSTHLFPTEISKQHALSLRELTINDDYTKSPCPTIYHCLGYQACVFEYHNDLCQRDAIPFQQSYLLLTVGCFRDDLYEVPRKFQRNQDLVLHLLYSSFQKPSEMDYSMANLSHIEVPERKAFSGNCPRSDVIEKEGYFGNCSNEHISDDDMSLKLWPMLGKVQSESCRRKIIESTCAFQFNKFGLCIPPIFLTNKNVKSDRTYSALSLPHHEFSLSLEKYMTFLSKTIADFIPTRLAFVIMTHRNVQGTMALLNSIYRKHFLYIIHVDKSEYSTREELSTFVQKSYPESNVFIMPPERSFSSATESYDIVRAKLESFEAVLNHGIWDFVITLTEEDMAIRNVDDLAIALAPHRGLSFLPDIRLLNDSHEEHVVSCHGKLYKISSSSYVSTKNDFQLYSSTQDGILSRNFIEYLVDEEKRSDFINKRQFFLQSTPSSANSYIPTVLMHSVFKDSVRFASFHVIKPFLKEANIQKYSQELLKDKLDEQEEQLVSDDSDVSVLASISHTSFFVRKVDSFTSMNALNFAFDLCKGEYYQMLGKYFPTSILKVLIEDALAKFSARKNSLSEKLSLENVLNLQIVPSFVSQAEFCNDKYIVSYSKFADFNYWVDILLYNKNNRREEKARIMLQQSIRTKTCYRKGILRMVSVSPWYSKSNDTESFRWSNFEQNLPLPYFPAGVKGVFANILVAVESPVLDHSTDFKGNLITLKFSLVSPDETTECSETVDVSLNEDFGTSSTTENEYIRERLYESHHVPIPCSNMKPGLWKLLVIQINPKKSKQYITPFYLLDLNKLDDQLSEVASLWTLKNFEFITENLSYDFVGDELNQKRDFFLQTRSPHKKTSAKAKVFYTKTRKSVQENFNEENKNSNIFICGGGFTSSSTVFLSVIILFCGWKYRFHQKILLYFVLILCAVTTIQIIFILTLCT